MTVEDAINLFLAGGGTAITKCFVDLGFAESVSDAKRQIQQGAAKFNGKKLTDPSARVFNIEDSLFVVEKVGDKINIIT